MSALPPSASDARPSSERLGERPGAFVAMLKSFRAVIDGLAVTLSYMFRPAATVQYPDRLAAPLPQSLPERYRGFLEVDLDTCTACKACERDCPINCIVIDVEKVGDVRAMTRFDIDMGKCMYCNICVESCPIPVRCPGDEEETKCIRMTREFEAATDTFATLTFRFVRPGDAAIPFRPKKGVVPESPVRGSVVQQIRRRAQEYNVLASKWAAAHGPRDDSDEAILAPEALTARMADLRPKVEQAAGEPRRLEDLVFSEALAQTDCQACGYTTCREYARALVGGGVTDFARCEPGGTRSKRDLELIFQIRREARQ